MTRRVLRVRFKPRYPASLQGTFVLAFLCFVVALTIGGPYYAWREANRALEAELDLRVEMIARSAAATGLLASVVSRLRPGYEDTSAWTSTHSRLNALHGIVERAYLIMRDPVNDAEMVLVSSLPADSIPIGTFMVELDAYRAQLEEARREGYAHTASFDNPQDGRFYKWGFAALLDDKNVVLAVLMPADYEVPLDNLQRNLMVGGMIAMIVAAVLASALATGVARPLARLSRAALRIQRGHIREPVAEERTLEVGRLARAMERMRRGILERDENLRLMPAQVAHEIRNPLGGLDLFVAAAAETEDATERRRLLGRAREEAATLNRVISDFLAFARPVNVSNEATDARVPIREAVELVGAELAEKGGCIDVRLPPTPLMTRASDDHVKRMLLNLLRNAAHVSEQVTLIAETERGEVAISIIDEGPGIPRELRRRVFEPFVTDKEQGAGLGLAIVKKLAEANGGRVELAEADKGAVFRIFLRSLEDPFDEVHFDDQ